MLRNAKVAGVFYEERYRDNDIAALLTELRPRLADLRETTQLVELEQSAAVATVVPLASPVAPGDVLHVQFTSGTTGIPKGAILHHRGLVNSARLIAERAGFPTAAFGSTRCRCSTPAAWPRHALAA